MREDRTTGSLPRLSRLTKLGFAYYVGLTIAIAVGLIIGGGTGYTIVAIAAVIFALTIFAAFGSLRPRPYPGGRRYGPSVEEEEERERRLRE